MSVASAKKSASASARDPPGPAWSLRDVAAALAVVAMTEVSGGVSDAASTPPGRPPLRHMLTVALARRDKPPPTGRRPDAAPRSTRWLPRRANHVPTSKITSSARTNGSYTHQLRRHLPYRYRCRRHAARPSSSAASGTFIRVTACTSVGSPAMRGSRGATCWHRGLLQHSPSPLKPDPTPSEYEKEVRRQTYLSRPNAEPSTEAVQLHLRWPQRLRPSVSLACGRTSPAERGRRGKP